MAFPQIQTNAVTAGGKSTSVTADAPAGIVSGDLLIAQILRPEQNGNVTAPAGWTLKGAANLPTTSGRLSVFHKIAGASEPATYEFTWFGNSRAVTAITRISGVDTAAPFKGSLPAWVTGNGTSHDPPNADAGSTGDHLFLIVCGATGATDPRFTPPANYTELYDANTGGPGSQAGSIFLGWRQLAAQSDDPGAVTGALFAPYAVNTLIVAPSSLVTGSGSINVATSTAATGSKQGSSSGTISAAVSVAGAGRKLAAGSGTVAAATSATGAGGVGWAGPNWATYAQLGIFTTGRTHVASYTMQNGGGTPNRALLLVVYGEDDDDDKLIVAGSPTYDGVAATAFVGGQSDPGGSGIRSNRIEVWLWLDDDLPDPSSPLPADFSVTLGGAGDPSDNVAYYVIELTNAGGVEAWTPYTGGSGSAVARDITTLTADSLVIGLFCASVDNATVTFTGLAERYDDAIISGPADQRAAAADAQEATAGLHTYTFDPDSTPSRRIDALLAVIPPSGIVTGSGAIAVTTSAAGTGSKTASGVGTVPVAGTLAASGVKLGAGAGAISVAVLTSGTGGRLAAGSGAIAVTVTTAGAGSRSTSGTGAVGVSTSAAAEGSKTASGAGTVSVAVTLTGSGAATGAGQGLIAVAVTVTGSGAAVGGPPSGSGAIAVTTSAAAAGTRSAAGTGAVGVSTEAAATGAKVGAAAAAISVVSTAAAGGAKTARGAGTVSVAVTVSGAGQVAGPVTGSGAITVTSSAAAAGSKTARGAGTVSVAVTVSGAGTGPAQGAGAIAATVELAGTGTKATTGAASPVTVVTSLIGGGFRADATLLVSVHVAGRGVRIGEPELNGIRTTRLVVQISMGDPADPDALWDSALWDVAEWVGYDRSWFPVSDYVVSVKTQAGRSVANETFPAGAATLRLINTGGEWTLPSAGPGQVDLAVGQRCRVAIETAAAGVTPIWTGQIQRIQEHYGRAGTAWVDLQCIDAMAMLGGPKLYGAYWQPGDTTKAAVASILDGAAWPSGPGWRNVFLAVAQHSLEAYEADGEAAVDLLRRVADAEGGAVFADTLGRLTFRGRDWLTGTQTNPPDITLDTEFLGDLDVRDIAPRLRALDRVINEARYRRASQFDKDPIIRSDPLSRGRHGLRIAERFDLLCELDLQVGELAQRLINHRSVVRPELRTVTVRPPDDAKAALAVGAKIGDVANVDYQHPREPWTWNQDANLVGVKHEIRKSGAWTVTFHLDASYQDAPNGGED